MWQMRLGAGPFATPRILPSDLISSEVDLSLDPDTRDCIVESVPSLGFGRMSIMLTHLSLFSIILICK